LRRSNPRGAGKSPTTPAWLFFVGIMTGTLAEKVERDVRAYPDDYRATGQWLDDFSLLHGSRLKTKLSLKKTKFEESGIQKEANKLKRKARTTGTKKAKEAAEKVARLCQSRKNDITKLKKQINTFQAYIENPKGKSPVANFVLIFEAWEYICSEEPQDIKKILLIFWLLTDRFVETTGPGLTRFEKWSYGDDRACADPREQFGTRHWTLEELLSRENQIIPMVEAAMRATARNRETEQKVSGGKAGNETEAYFRKHDGNNLFVKKFDNWEIVYKGKPSPQISGELIGMKCLIYLIRNQGDEFTHTEIITAARNNKFDTQKLSSDEAMNEGLTITETGKLDSGEILDGLENYGPDTCEKAIVLLEREKGQTDDPAKKLEIQEEIDKIQKCLESSTDIHGRPRKVADPTEANRVNVRQRINTVLEEIKPHHKALWQHLSDEMRKTGYKSYRPDPPVGWKFPS